MTFSLESVIVGTAFIGSFFLGLFTLLKNPKSSTNRLFFLFAITLALYLVTNYLLSHQVTDQATFFWVKIVMSIAPFINLLFFLLAITFPHQSMPIKKIVLYLFSVITIAFVGLAENNLIFTSAKTNGGGGIPGPAIPFFLLHTILFLGIGFFILVKKFRKSVGVEKSQIKLFLLGSVFMFISILVTNLFFVLVLHTSAYVGLLPIYTLIFVGCISYAIVKHRFLDISLLVARSVAYILMLLVLGGFYSMALIFIGSKLLRIQFTMAEFLLFGFVMFVVAFSFHRVRNFLETVTDKFLYKGYYDAQELLKHLSTIMSTNIALSQITEKILDVVIKSLRITRGVYVLLGSKDKGKIEFIFNKGYDHVPEFTVSQVEVFLNAKKTIIFDDLEEGDLKKLMREHQLSVALPLIVNEEHIGIFGLGEKQSGDTYSDQDIKVLEILAPQLAVAIQNSQEFEEIKRFNITLKDEVDSATKELRDANEQLKQLDKMKDEFVSLASHELKTPMASIKSYLWFILFGGEKIGTLNEKQKMYADRAYNAVERLIKLVTDMLNMSRLEGGRIKLTLAQVDMIQLAKDVVTEIAGNAQSRGVAVEIVPFEGELPKVGADADRVKEVVINLVGNSIKFTPAGGRVTISFEKDGEFVKTVVKDTGKGITPEQMPMLFQKFGLIEGNYLTRAAVVEGTGLGLYLSKSLIELHGGKMEVSSEGENKGATFSFTLPVFKQETVVQNSQPQQPTVSQVPVVASV